MLPPVTEIPANALIVVVVDDDVFARMGASYMFTDAGYRVLEAENADEALRFFETTLTSGCFSRTSACPDR